MFGRKQTILNDVREYLAYDNSISSDLLAIVAGNWEAMVKQQELRRESIHLKTLRDAVHLIHHQRLSGKSTPKPFDRTECSELLEILDAVCPTGEAKRDTPAVEEVVKHFAYSCRLLGWHPDDDFIRNIRGKSDFLINIYANNPDRENES